MVLIADRDSYSNTSLSNTLRKMGVARNVVCTTSANNALTYLQKQQICDYPFPEVIMYNQRNLGYNAIEFIEHFKMKFSGYYNSKIILLQEKDAESPIGIFNQEDLILGGLKKPISFRHLQKLFTNQNRALTYS
jgi:hypothetical protein